VTVGDVGKLMRGGLFGGAALARNAATLAAWFEAECFTRRGLGDLGSNQKLWALADFAIALSARWAHESELHSTMHAAGGIGISGQLGSVLPLRSAAEQMPQGLLEVRAAES